MSYPIFGFQEVETWTASKARVKYAINAIDSACFLAASATETEMKALMEATAKALLKVWALEYRSFCRKRSYKRRSIITQAKVFWDEVRDFCKNTYSFTAVYDETINPNNDARRVMITVQPNNVALQLLFDIEVPMKK